MTDNSTREEIFSYFVLSFRDPTTSHGGTILLGGINKKHQKGEFTTVSLTSTSSWTFRMSKLVDLCMLHECYMYLCYVIIICYYCYYYCVMLIINVCANMLSDEMSVVNVRN